MNPYPKADHSRLSFLHFVCLLLLPSFLLLAAVAPMVADRRTDDTGWCDTTPTP